MSKFEPIKVESDTKTYYACPCCERRVPRKRHSRKGRPRATEPRYTLEYDFGETVHKSTYPSFSSMSADLQTMGRHHSRQMLMYVSNGRYIRKHKHIKITKL